MAKICLVLGAGFAKGAYQYGALRALLEHITIEQLDAVSASSIGALNAIGFCAGKMDTIGELWTAVAEKAHNGFIGWTLRSKYFDDALGIIADEVPELKTRLYIALTNVSDMSIEYIKLNSAPAELLRDYVHASVSMPGFNKMVTIGKKKYIDGGWVDNIPVMPVKKREPDYTILIHFDQGSYVFEDQRFDERIINVTFPDKTMFSNALFLKSESVAKMISEGYEVAGKIFDEAFANGPDDVETVLSYIRKQNANRPPRQLRLTTDVVISNINKVTKRLTARKDKWTYDE